VAARPAQAQAATNAARPLDERFTAMKCPLQSAAVTMSRFWKRAVAQMIAPARCRNEPRHSHADTTLRMLDLEQDSVDDVLTGSARNSPGRLCRRHHGSGRVHSFCCREDSQCRFSRTQCPLRIDVQEAGAQERTDLSPQLKRASQVHPKLAQGQAGANVAVLLLAGRLEKPLRRGRLIDMRMATSHSTSRHLPPRQLSLARIGTCPLIAALSSNFRH
jgi:hypothetical protein